MSENTRVWWDGAPVRFIRWTEKGLVFHWGDPNETAIHMPRGTVVRLMEKGVLEIEGYLPDWFYGRKSNEPRQNRDSQQTAAPKTSNKLSIITRLIKKLSGGDSVHTTH
jgi:hypothetical protein